MTYARALRWTAGAAMVTASLLATAPAHAGPAHAARTAAPSYADDAGDPADPVFEELAGSAAGAGRERPGLPVSEPANPEAVVVSRPVPVRPRPEPAPPDPLALSVPAVAGALGTEPNERAADLAAHMLPLGTGFALMGTGLGFMGMRLRRGR
ncbi:hypothetical protein J7F03_04270 [Streptomyces sp. ISL-43]|uniref:hypothetical protein n=1 Tax=Streptomyces sp. ISL-43 TaxID=2819183 RepID=UPI001BEC31A9|nr:hypothetical protein [Streptomyces sp. ISL-43]MBT2446310.1 hypothetical protein [Streptomyces sp. ISL-43]